MTKKIRGFLVIIFYLSVLFFTFYNLLADRSSGASTVKPPSLKNLFSGSLDGYLAPGASMKPFKVFLPKHGRITFLMDRPVMGNLGMEKFYYDAQNYLAPLILNPEPVERFGIIFCTNEITAQKRLRETGYRWVLPLAKGKGIIQKGTP